MQARARNPSRGERSYSDVQLVGRPVGRNGTLLALLAAALLALCAWLFVRSGRPAGDLFETSKPAQTSMPLSDAHQLHAVHVAESPPNRTLAAEVEFAVLPAPAVVEVNRPETRIYGSLFDASRTPIDAAWSAAVSFVEDTGMRHQSDAKSDGSYALHALEFGTYRVTASAWGYRSLEQTLELYPDGPVVRKDFVLQASVQLRIKVVTPDGRNLLDVLKATGAPMGARMLVPVATLDRPGERLEAAAGSLDDKDSVGRFWNFGPRAEQLAPGCMGVLLLDGELPVWVSLVHHHKVLQSKLVEAGQDEVTFILSPAELVANLATIRVRVIDAQTGSPIQGARVQLRGGTNFDVGVATDRSGIATVEHREPGRFELEIRRAGYERNRLPIDAQSGETTDLGTIALDKELTVEGRVLDHEGHPHPASFSLGILDSADHSIHWPRNEAFKSDGDGSFVINGLSRREYVMRTSNHDAIHAAEWEGTTWVSGNAPIDMRNGSVSGLEIHLRPASKLVLEAASTAADALGFRVVDEHGLELVAGRFHGSHPRPLALPPGNHRILLLDARGVVLSERCMTLGSESVQLDLAR